MNWHARKSLAAIMSRICFQYGSYGRLPCGTSCVQPYWLLAHNKLDAKLEIGGEAKDKLLLSYPPINVGTGYVQPVINLEFGVRATGEPHGVMRVVCDMDGHVEGITFPVATPVVMSVERTFWEMATAAHVYCAQGRIRGERYARHWHDLAAIARSKHFDAIVADRGAFR